MSRLSHFIRLCILLIGLQAAFSITAKLKKNEQFCTFKNVEKGAAFIGEYVISGFAEKKVNVMVYSPENKVIYKNEENREGQWDMVAQEGGEYRVCFRSKDSKEKFVSFSLNSGHSEATQDSITSENVKDFKDDMYEAYRLLRKISQNQRFQKSRSEIHKQNSDILASRIHWSSIFKALVLFAVAGAQAMVLTGFITKKRTSQV